MPRRRCGIHCELSPDREAAMRELAINQFSGLFAEDSQASYGSDGMD